MYISKKAFFAAALLTLPVLTISALTMSQPALAAQAIPDTRGAVQDKLPQPQAQVENKLPAPGSETASQGQTFRLHQLQVDREGLDLKDSALQELTSKYVKKDITLADLNQALAEVTHYCRTHGYPAAAAYLPNQTTGAGSLTIKIIPGRYGRVNLDNQSGLKDAVAQGYLNGLKSGDIITTNELETALYNISGLGGVQAAGVLSPGSEVGTSDVNVKVTRGKKNVLILYAENYGSTSSGRYRYGVQDTVNNLSGRGDRLSLGGLVSNHNLRNYAINYETPVGHSGTTVGVGYSRMDYELGETFSSLGAQGKADTYSIYGKTPLYVTTDKSLYVNYGYNYRKLTDELEAYNLSADKHSHAFFLGLSGHNREKKAVLQYDLTGYQGTLGMDSDYARLQNQYSNTEGAYTKGVLNFKYVQGFDNRWDLLVKGQGQLASRNLDSSEDIYLGGPNAIRAYPQGEASGDLGYVATAELRYKTGVPGLVLSTYFDTGRVELSKDGSSGSETLKGYGFAISYTRPDDWFARFDYARRIGGDDNMSTNAQDRGRMWFLLGKVF